jgi:hypothetical protein
MTKYLFLILFFGYLNLAFCQEKVLVINDSITNKNVIIFENSNVEVKINSDVNCKYLKGKLKVLNDSMLAINQDTFFLESLIDLKINTIKIPIRVAASIVGAGLISSSVYLVRKGYYFYSDGLKEAWMYDKMFFRYGLPSKDPITYCFCLSVTSLLYFGATLVINIVALTPSLIGIPLMGIRHYKNYSINKNKNSKVRLSRFYITELKSVKKSK